jgi:hypothetical protein
MSTMRDDQIAAEIERHMAVLRGPASQQDYDAARSAIAALRAELARVRDEFTDD